MTNAISMINLTKHYNGVEALTDLTLDVPAGTVYGFLGPNGAGKTTAMKVDRGPRAGDGGTAHRQRDHGVARPGRIVAISATSPRIPVSTAG